jgi:nicotinamide-nucleotide amidase
MRKQTTATIITIGDELLIGQIIDTNSAWIAQQLSAIGVTVAKRVAIGDTAEAIRAALDQEAASADLILLTGGLGPTADDVTKPTLCDYFGGQLVVDEGVLTHIKGIMSRWGRPFLERNLKQAEVPDVCRVIHNSIGSAPGMWFEKEGTVYVSMPGVPFEMKQMMTDILLPEFSHRFAGQAIVHDHIFTIGEGESFVAERIKDIEAQLPSYIGLAYLPSPYMVKLRLSASGNDAAVLRSEVQAFGDAIADRIRNIVVARTDEALEVLVGGKLKELGLSIGLAESCTGGYIGHLITQVKGSSAYFKGSIVTYATEAKINLLHMDPGFIKEHGVVSEAVAAAMATAAASALHSDIGLGITGILSDGDYEDQSAVGTVFVAVSRGTKILSQRFQLRYDRIQNKHTAAQMALHMIWKLLQEGDAA